MCLKKLGRSLAMTMDWLTSPRRIKREPALQEQVDIDSESMTLYYHSDCMFCCWHARRAAHRLNLALTLCDLAEDDRFRQQLLDECGADEVPCLRIQAEDGPQWLSGNKAIVDYLEARFH